MITGSEAFHARSHINHYASPLMPQNSGKGTFRIITREGKSIGVTHTRGLDFHQDLTSLRASQINITNFQGFTGTEGHCCASFHRTLRIKVFKMPLYFTFASIENINF